jgi:hypothetical protein
VTLVDFIEGPPSCANNVSTRKLEAHVVDDRRTALATLAQTRPDGIVGFLIGNTAETVLRELRGSVFVVKPLRSVTEVAVPDHVEHAATV